MDLTKVTLPTFILERRSLLEMYADFFAHPDKFVGSCDLSSAEERFISVVRYYLGAFYAARKSGVAKKPYNPILGETFRCKSCFVALVSERFCFEHSGTLLLCVFQGRQRQAVSLACIPVPRDIVPRA